MKEYIITLIKDVQMSTQILTQTNFEVLELINGQIYSILMKATTTEEINDIMTFSRMIQDEYAQRYYELKKYGFERSTPITSVEKFKKAVATAKNNI